MDSETDSEPLATLLRSSSPGVTRSPEVDRQIDTMVGASRAHVERKPAPRRIPRAAVISAAAVIAISGATAAAATSGILNWSPWAENPTAAGVYVLPSGISCEFRLGKFEGANSASVSAAKDYVRDNDFTALAIAQVPRVIVELREGQAEQAAEEGHLPDGAFGTDSYSADREYNLALSTALNDLIYEELARQGFDQEGSEFVSVSAEGICESNPR